AEEAFVAQAEQRLAHRRAAHAQALAELGLREAVAGDEAEVVDLRLDRVVDLVGELAARLAAGQARHGAHDAEGADGADGADGAITLTCAATTFQPSAKRTQVWLCRPTFALPSR